MSHPGDFAICAECGEPRHRHRFGAVHKFAGKEELFERDRAFIASLRELGLTELEALLSRPYEDWKFWAAAFAHEMNYSWRPGKARWAACRAVIAMRVADEYRDHDRKLALGTDDLECEMLEEMRGGK